MWKIACLLQNPDLVDLGVSFWGDEFFVRKNASNTQAAESQDHPLRPQDPRNVTTNFFV